MDKEIEKIDCKLWKNDYYQGLGDDRMFDYRDKVILRYGKLIGYRKPKEKPALLSDEQLESLKAEYEGILEVEWHPTVFYLLDAIAQAQWDICVKHSEGEKPLLVCPLCGKPSKDGREHKECMDREAMLADRLGEKPPFSVGCGGDS